MFSWGQDLFYCTLISCSAYQAGDGRQSQDLPALLLIAGNGFYWAFLELQPPLKAGITDTFPPPGL